MGWLGLSFGITLIFLMIVHYNNRKHNWRTPIKNWVNTDTYVYGGLVAFVMSLLIVALCGGVYATTGDGHNINAEGCTEWMNRWEIVSAVRDKEYNSSFILGTGGGSTVDTYYVYRVDPEGLMLVNYKAHRTYVVEREGPPQYERIDTICPMPVYDFMWWSSGNTHRNVNKKGTLYVPPGTVLREFRM